MTRTSRLCNSDERSGSMALGLLTLMRRRVRRRKNLAELRALDRSRLADIGLNESSRAQILG